MNHRRMALMLWLLLAAAPALAIDPLPFQSAVEERRFQALVAELRKRELCGRCGCCE